MRLFHFLERASPTQPRTRVTRTLARGRVLSRDDATGELWLEARRGAARVRRRNTSGDGFWKEDMMARGVMLRELLCSSSTTGP